MQVVDHDHAGRRAVARQRDQLADGLEEPQPGPGVVQARIRRRPQLGQEAGGLARVVDGDVALEPLDGGAQELGEHAVRERPFARRRPRRDDRRAPLVERRDHLVRKPGFADARLALNHGQSSLGGDGRVQLDQPPPRVGAADERLLGGRDGHRRLGRGRRSALVDGVVELGRLGQRAHAQLAVERPDAAAVLLQCVGPPAGSRVALDQAAVGGLVERIERQPLLGPGDGLVGAARRGERADEPVERRRPLLADALAGELLPVVERGGRANCEPREQVAAVQVDGAAEGPAAPAAGSAAVRRNSARSNQAPSRSSAIDAPVGRDEPVAERGAQRRERPSQRRPRAVDVELGPEQRRHHLPALGVPGYRQVGQHRGRLARVDVERAPLEFHERRPQK